MTEAQRQSLLAFMRGKELEDERRLDEAGVPWVVVCREEEYGYGSAYGPCSEIQACEIAQRLGLELTEEFPEGRWNVWLMRLAPPDDVPKSAIENGGER